MKPRWKFNKEDLFPRIPFFSAERGLSLYFLISSIFPTLSNQLAHHYFRTVIYLADFFQTFPHLCALKSLSFCHSIGCPSCTPPPPHLHLSMVILKVLIRVLQPLATCQFLLLRQTIFLHVHVYLEAVTEDE